MQGRTRNLANPNKLSKALDDTDIICRDPYNCNCRFFTNDNTKDIQLRKKGVTRKMKIMLQLHVNEKRLFTTKYFPCLFCCRVDTRQEPGSLPSPQQSWHSMIYCLGRQHLFIEIKRKIIPTSSTTIDPDKINTQTQLNLTLRVRVHVGVCLRWELNSKNFCITIRNSRIVIGSTHTYM